MLIATSVVAIAAAASIALETAAPSNPPSPPIVVAISAAPDVKASVVARIIAEAEAVFRPAGITFIWRRAEHALATLRVSIGNESMTLRAGGTALGWIVFEDGRPDNEIHLSLANAKRYLEDAGAVVGPIGNMPLFEREHLLGRALGRALAHELGHYLLATKEHTPKGLLKAVRTAQDFFSPERSGFRLAPGQRSLIAARLRAESVVASR